uniref:Variant surface glycoprotein n=1 Tax=Trypanosoma brucei TaxID=5691 RepID=A0A1V0FXX4_9TRYP|nr:variant surface glycoprotein [Trypanosoma brucei]
MNRTRQTQKLLLVATVVVTLANATTIDDSSPSTALTTPCLLQQYLAKKLGDIQRKAAEAQQTFEANRQQTTQWLLASLKSTGKNRIAFALLHAMGEAENAEQRPRVTALQEAAATAATVVNRRLGAVAQAMLLSSGQISDDIDAVSGSPPTTPEVQLTFKPAPAIGVNCDLGTSGEISEGRKKLTDKTTTKISIIKDEQLKSLALSGKPILKCTKTDNTGQNWAQDSDNLKCTDANGGSTSNRKIKLMLGANRLFNTLAGADTDLKTGSTTKVCGDLQGVTNKLWPTENEVTAVICKGLDEAAAIQALSEIKLDSLAGNQHIKDAIATLYEKKATPTETVDILNDIFGKDAAAFEATYIKGAATTEYQYANGENTGSEQLSKIVAGSKVGSAIAVLRKTELLKPKETATGSKYEEKESDKKIDTEDKTGAKKEGDKKDECKATEEKDCDTKKCDWNKDKNECKVKEGAAVISYVMKAPLLLAFLLF